MDKRILVVDDDESTIDFTKSILLLAKYQVVKADSEAKAVEILDLDPPDAAIIDIHLTKTTEMQGLGLCRRIKANLRTQHLPVIMVSGDDRDESLISKSFAVDAVDFLSKPFKAVELLARLEKCLKDTSPLRWALDAGKFARAGSLCLDVESYEVFFEGRQLTRLTPVSASLLCVFIRQPETVFRKAALYAKAWPMRTRPCKDLRLVDKAMERLKKRLGPELSPLFETVPSAGYRFSLRKSEAAVR